MALNALCLKADCMKGVKERTWLTLKNEKKAVNSLTSETVLLLTNARLGCPRAPRLRGKWKACSCWEDIFSDLRGVLRYDNASRDRNDVGAVSLEKQWCRLDVQSGC